MRQSPVIFYMCESGTKMSIITGHENPHENTVFSLLGVHQVALLTHIDKICEETAKDASHVYTSQVIREAVG